MRGGSPSHPLPAFSRWIDKLVAGENTCGNALTPARLVIFRSVLCVLFFAFAPPPLFNFSLHRSSVSLQFYSFRSPCPSLRRRLNSHIPLHSPGPYFRETAGKLRRSFAQWAAERERDSRGEDVSLQSSRHAGETHTRIRTRRTF